MDSVTDWSSTTFRKHALAHPPWPTEGEAASPSLVPRFPLRSHYEKIIPGCGSPDFKRFSFLDRERGERGCTRSRGRQRIHLSTGKHALCESRYPPVPKHHRTG